MAIIKPSQPQIQTQIDNIKAFWGRLKAGGAELGGTELEWPSKAEHSRRVLDGATRAASPSPRAPRGQPFP
jgi:hypothetical protein